MTTFRTDVPAPAARGRRSTFSTAVRALCTDGAIGASFHVPDDVAVDLTAFRDNTHAATALRSTGFYPSRETRNTDGTAGRIVTAPVGPGTDYPDDAPGVRVWRIAD